MYKKDFPIFTNTKFNGFDLVYLDSAATSQKPQIVISKLKEFYEKYNANIYRGIYKLSEESTELYEKTRSRVADFLNVSSSEIVFTKGTTDGINFIVYAYAKNKLKKGDLVLLTEMEHHSNIVPWQILSKNIGFNIEYVPVSKEGKLKDLDKFLEFKPKILSITHVSNVLGSVNDISYISNMAHKIGCTVIVDGAQAVSHMKVDLKLLDCDFYVFSAHKMFGPTGVGILYGKNEILSELEPIFGGGEMISSVTKDGVVFKSSPFKFEAGTQNFADVSVFSNSIDYIENIGINNISSYIKDLHSYAVKKLKGIKGLRIYGEGNLSGIVSFDINGIHPHDIATLLNENNIAVRAGHHCAQILMSSLGVSSLTRCSLQIYNDKSDIDKLVSSLDKIVSYFK